MPRKRKYKYHEDGILPPSDADYYFVFGSNLRGAHGKGAALVAKELYGAEYGIGIGVTGKCYCIPTKDRFIRTLPLSSIRHSIALFIEFTHSRPELNFWVTAVGCGLAGYKHSDIAPMFAGANTNCNFPKQWIPFLH